MLVNVQDNPLKYQPFYKKLCDHERFMIYMEQIKSTGIGGIKPVESNVWRVYYTDKEKSPIPVMRHYPNKQRAEIGFDDAVDWNGFSDLH